MDVTLYAVAVLLLIGGLYFFLKARREGGGTARKRGPRAQRLGATHIGGQFSSGEWGELEGARRSS